ncbi:gluconate 2-dehydrogenase subunit 3 family protein [Zhouia sp. PK063]|uniref:gluconate 2-dehydrogenase subunit 3 family protein n=1 Tax=Zhouia sp. PK063 TaxID=3373602 RepID=UPI0037BB8DCC
MDRRHALKNLGMSIGFVMATPSVLSLLQSCKNDPDYAWVPSYLSPEEGVVLMNVVDVILPKTDTPSASEVNVPQFIDKYIDEVVPLDDQKGYKDSFAVLVKRVKTMANEDNINKVKPEVYEELVAKTLKISPKEKDEMYNRINKMQAVDKEDKAGNIDEDASIFQLITGIRSLTIMGYKTSEEIGKNVLAYDPVPGKYVPCGTVEELTQGKAWSL